MKRFNSSRRCPICNGYDGEERGIGKRCFGFLSDDGEWAHCTREEYAGCIEKHENSNTYAHKLVGDCKCGKRHDPSPAKQITAAYDYCDENGELLYQVVRYEPKDFRQRRPDGKGDWIWNLEGVQRVLYRLPQLLSADKEAMVFIVEGEKDADCLASLGLVTTTNAGGAEKWRDEYNEHLRGRHVVILPDNDEAGRKHTDKIAASLHGIAASVSIVMLPDLPEKGDVSDWLDAGRTVEQLLTIVANAEQPSPSDSSDTQSASIPKYAKFIESAKELMEAELPETKWIVPNLISDGATIFAGAPKQGKSWLALGVSLAVALGGYALGKIPVDAGDVLYLALEDGNKRMQKRLRGMLKGALVPERLHLAYTFPLVNQGGLELIEEWLIDHPEARLIVVDTLKRLRPVVRSKRNQYDVDYEAVSGLNDLAQRYGVAILIVTHTKKEDGEEIDWFNSISGSLGLTGAVDAAMLLRRPRNQSQGSLSVSGRDTGEKVLAVQFDGTIDGWQLLGEAISDKAQKVKSWLIEAGREGLSMTNLIRRNGGRSDGLRDALEELRAANLAEPKIVQPTGKGKAQERWYAKEAPVPKFAVGYDEDNEHDEDEAVSEIPLNSSNSSNSSHPYNEHSLPF
jgi:AAA domain